MRKYLLILLLAMAGASEGFAQDADPWVGTWTSESYLGPDWAETNKNPDGGIVETSFKRIIRITKKDGQYTVRSKIMKVNNPEDVSYALPLAVKKVEGNTMWLESYVEKDPFTVNGKIDEYSDITYYFKLTLKGDILHYSHYKYHTVDYNSRMVYKGEKTYPCGDWRGNNLDCFSDDW